MCAEGNSVESSLYLLILFHIVIKTTWILPILLALYLVIIVTASTYIKTEQGETAPKREQALNTMVKVARLPYLYSTFSVGILSLSVVLVSGKLTNQEPIVLVTLFYASVLFFS